MMHACIDNYNKNNNKIIIIAFPHSQTKEENQKQYQLMAREPCS